MPLPSLGCTSIGTELDLTPIQPQGAGATPAFSLPVTAGGVTLAPIIRRI